ncbi:MAG: PilN domain-containing protein [Planctomycetota bacterium]|jgi:hypothetical protein
MKEIDLLPSWYKSDRRQQISYRTQYIALGAIFVAMMLCNFVTTGAIRKATAEVALREAEAAAGEQKSREFAKIKDELDYLQERANTLKEIDSQIEVAEVLGEISFLIGEKVVLKRVEFRAEKFPDRQAEKANSGSVIRVAGLDFAGKKAVPLGSVRFRVVMSGVASDASDVAALICRLEDSSYFCQVIPSFSRNRKIKTGKGTGAGNLQVSEFEISCDLANYRYEDEGAGRGSQKR